MPNALNVGFFDETIGVRNKCQSIRGLSYTYAPEDCNVAPEPPEEPLIDNPCNTCYLYNVDNKLFSCSNQDTCGSNIDCSEVNLPYMLCEEEKNRLCTGADYMPGTWQLCDPCNSCWLEYPANYMRFYCLDDGCHPETAGANCKSDRNHYTYSNTIDQNNWKKCDLEKSSNYIFRFIDRRRIHLRKIVYLADADYEDVFDLIPCRNFAKCTTAMDRKYKASNGYCRRMTQYNIKHYLIITSFRSWKTPLFSSDILVE